MRATVRLGAVMLATVFAASAPTCPAWGSPLVSSLLAKGRGRPNIELDRLDFPDMVGAAGHEQHLKRALARAAREADWGVGRGHTIEYRIEIRALTLSQEGGVLRVRCLAVGRLPGGKAATSQLSFGGDPRQTTKLVRQVLEIVARGVITRLAALERKRRGVDSQG